MRLFVLASIAFVGAAAQAQSPTWADEDWYLSAYHALISPMKVEVDLTKWQEARIQTISERVFGGKAGAATQSPWSEWYRQAEAILAPSQRLRLHEVLIQARGPEILTNPALAAEFGVTPQQTAKIQSIVAELVGEDRPASSPPKGFPDADALKKAFADMRSFPGRHKAASQRILDVLTPDQRRKWKAMIGKPFRQTL